MKRITYAEIEEKLRSEAIAALPSIRCAVLRNIVVEPIEPWLRYMAYEIGFNATCVFGEYDNVFQEAVSSGGQLLTRDTDCVLVFLRLETLSWDLARNFSGLSAQLISSEKARIEDLISNVLNGIRRQTSAMILWHSFELPVYPAPEQTAVIESLNQILRQALARAENAYYIDLNLALARIGAEAFYDVRYWHIGKAPYSRDALREISIEILKHVRALKGKQRKCLVLDCDNTLWGGIVGEDGLPAIKLGKTYPGSAYYEFQQEILNLYNRGIMIALCSKNNEADVWEVFERHPDMLLRKEHIAAAQINWDNKITNLKQLAADLNIGLDSLVFADDSEFETEQVRQYLPEVDVIELPPGRAVEYREMLARYPGFFNLTVTEEDKTRGAMYKAEANRKELQATSLNLEDYYQSLEMVLEIKIADGFSIPRIAQLTQKTNQFNLTTRRYSDADIRRFTETDTSDVLYTVLKDRFGDSGIVGVCILKYEANQAIIDSFLLSCRVLGRGVEEAFLAHCLKRAKRRCTTAIGEYRRTAKNGQVKDFYSRRGFQVIDSNDEMVTYSIELEGQLTEPPRFFKSIESQVDL